MKIVEVFDDLIKDEAGYGLREYLEDTLTYGQSAFTYYWEGAELYDQWRSDCEAWLETLVSERGLKPWEIFPDWEVFPDSEINKWLVITAMFEEYCQYMLEGF